VVPDRIVKVVEQNAAEPAEQLVFAVAGEAMKVALRFQERVLNQIRRSDPGLKVLFQFTIRDEQQVVATPLQQLTEGILTAQSRVVKKSVQLGMVFHGRLLSSSSRHPVARPEIPPPCANPVGGFKHHARRFEDFFCIFTKWSVRLVN
jgi:hypothetical protein